MWNVWKEYGRCIDLYVFVESGIAFNILLKLLLSAEGLCCLFCGEMQLLLFCLVDNMLRRIFLHTVFFIFVLQNFDYEFCLGSIILAISAQFSYDRFSLMRSVVLRAGQCAG